MSTRSMIWWHDEDTCVSRTYKHWDGYPGTKNGKDHGMLAEFQEFFREVKKQTKGGSGGTRFNHPEYLAAKYIVYWAAQYSENDARMRREGDRYPRQLDFLGIAPALEDHGDIEYRYHVWCGDYDGRGFPRVTWEEAGWSVDEEVEPDKTIDLHDHYVDLLQVRLSIEEMMSRLKEAMDVV